MHCLLITILIRNSIDVPLVWEHFTLIPHGGSKGSCVAQFVAPKVGTLAAVGKTTSATAFVDTPFPNCTCVNGSKERSNEGASGHFSLLVNGTAGKDRQLFTFTFDHRTHDNQNPTIVTLRTPPESDYTYATTPGQTGRNVTWEFNLQPTAPPPAPPETEKQQLLLVFAYGAVALSAFLLLFAVASTVLLRREPASPVAKASEDLSSSLLSREVSGHGRADSDTEAIDTQFYKLAADAGGRATGVLTKAIDFKELQLGDKIGLGASGVVLRARWRGSDVAVKRLNAMMSQEEGARFQAEVRHLASLRHPNVLLFLGTSFRAPDWYVVTELCARGSLLDLLRDEAVEINTPRMYQLILDAAKGINFLHCSNIIHRDLKSANLLVTDSFAVKVADFGVSRTIGASSVHTTALTGQLGTTPWTAPEMLRGQRYTEKIDVYSFAICLWEIATRSTPYQGMSAARVVSGVMSGMRPPMSEEIDATLDSLIQACWSERPELRPTFSQIIGTLEEGASAL